jgi:hypothetical protein
MSEDHTEQPKLPDELLLRIPYIEYVGNIPTHKELCELILSVQPMSQKLFRKVLEGDVKR